MPQAEGMAWVKAQGGERKWDSRKLREVLPLLELGEHAVLRGSTSNPFLQGGAL